MMNSRDNRILCTFTAEKNLGILVENIRNNYTLLYDKIFVLDLEDSKEIIVTYNVDIPNTKTFPENTVLVHRRKETNTLYTINALNVLIGSLNNGVSNKDYMLNWMNYRNSLLLTRDHIFCKINTKLRNII